MKKLSILFAITLAMAACSSTEEKMDKAEDSAKAEMESAKADMNAAKDSAEAKATEAMDKGKAAVADTGEASKTTCTLDKDTRVIEVRKPEAGGCELFYTKFGEEKSVASSGFGTQYCTEVRDRIQSNLDKAGFACQ